jgi:hypothetical protein
MGKVAIAAGKLIKISVRFMPVQWIWAMELFATLVTSPVTSPNCCRILARPETMEEPRSRSLFQNLLKRVNDDVKQDPD